MNLLFLLCSLGSWSALYAHVRASLSASLASLQESIGTACKRSYVAYLAAALFIWFPTSVVQLVGEGIKVFFGAFYDELVEERALSLNYWRRHVRKDT